MEDYLYRKKKKDLGELKDQLKKAIADEKEAKSFYGGIVNLAMRSEQTSVGGTMKTILNQESQHAEIIWRLLKDTEAAEAKLQKEFEESKKKEMVKEPHRRYGR